MNFFFCDKPELYIPSAEEKDDYPWTILSAEKPTNSKLQATATDPSLETDCN